MATEEKAVDYSLANPDTLTKYRTAAEISEKVLAAVKALCVAGEKIVTICQKGDALIEEEVAKVYRGKKITKGFAHPTTVSPSSFITPYTPLTSDASEAEVEIQAGETIKIQLGAQIDGFGTIICDTIIIPEKDGKSDVITGKPADLMLATYYANELLLRLMMPPGLLASGTDEEKAKAAAAKPRSQSQISALVEKVAKAYGCSIVESTTTWLFGRNEIEDKKKLVLAPGEGAKGDGTTEVGEVWGVEIGLSTGSGKTKQMEQRATLHRRTPTQYGLKRPTSRKILSEVQKKFGTFPFSLRQLAEEKDAKAGVVECVRSNVFRQYEVVADKEGAPVARLFTTIAITKNGVAKLAAPPALDLSKYKSDKKIEDEEILKLLESPLTKNTGKKTNKKKKKPTKKAKKPDEKKEEEEDEDEEDSDEE